MSNKIEPKWSDDQVKKLNDYQIKGSFHPFTGPGMNEDGIANIRGGSRANCPDGECLLKATEDGWVCPCGQYTQNWAHSFMAE